MKEHSRTALLVHIVTSAAGLAAVVSVITTVYILNDITDFHNDIRTDLKQFKVQYPLLITTLSQNYVDEAWSEMATASALQGGRIRREDAGKDGQDFPYRALGTASVQLRGTAALLPYPTGTFSPIKWYISSYRRLFRTCFVWGRAARGNGGRRCLSKRNRQDF